MAAVSSKDVGMNKQFHFILVLWNHDMTKFTITYSTPLKSTCHLYIFL